MHVTVNGEVITTTPEHPFYVPQKGWTGAIHLQAGDILVLSNGEYVVEKIEHGLLESSVKVYNFEVEDFHTYYVSELGVPVHDACRGKNKLKEIIRYDEIGGANFNSVTGQEVPTPHVHDKNTRSATTICI